MPIGVLLWVLSSYICSFPITEISVFCIFFGAKIAKSFETECKKQENLSYSVLFYIISFLNQSSNTQSAMKTPSFSRVINSLSMRAFLMRSILDLLPSG